MNTDFEKSKTKTLDFVTASGKACVVKEETFLASEAWLNKQNENGDDFDDDSAFEIKDDWNNDDIFMADDSGKGPSQERLLEGQKQVFQNNMQKKPRGIFTASVENMERDLHSPIPSIFEGFPLTPMVHYKSNPKVNKPFTPVTLTEEQKATLRSVRFGGSAERKRKVSDDFDGLIPPPPTPKTPLTEEQREKIKRNLEAALAKRRSLNRSTDSTSF
ncbi:hypothetical protein FO519_006980 [Halicephalobus sp. NKZ332]|nr:hypothetical protein FO519_006980 [Halicephalobus sp. NKZ332]